MASNLPASLVPDQYLTKDLLLELLHDFEASSSDSRSPARVFTSVVNNLRQPYAAALLRATEKLNTRGEENLMLRLALQAPGIQVPINSPACPSPGFRLEPQQSQPPALAVPVAAELAPKTWPESDSHTLYVFSTGAQPWKDYASWHSTPVNKTRADLALRMKLEVFRFEEPGLEKVELHRRRDPLGQIVCFSGTGFLNYEFGEKIVFWAYDAERPGTKRVSARNSRSTRSQTLVTGGLADDKVSDLESADCEFWVPVNRIVNGSLVVV